MLFRALKAGSIQGEGLTVGIFLVNTFPVGEDKGVEAVALFTLIVYTAEASVHTWFNDFCQW